MNLIDLLLVVILLFGIWSGWRKGLILGMLDLVILAGSIVAAFITYRYLAAFAEDYLVKPGGAWTRPLAFIAAYISVRFIIAALVNLLLKKIPEEAHYHGTNKWLGVIPGFITGLINATVLAALLLAVPFSEGISGETRDSRLADRLSIPAEWAETKFLPVFDEAVRKTLNGMTVEPGSEEMVRLPYTVARPVVREDLEAGMLKMMNAEREKRGLAPLVADPELVKVARSHSRDMFARGYFSHYTPEGKDPFDRMRAAHVRFLTAGENLSLARTLSLAHTGLMNSPGHRANILRPTFGRVGIGILDGGIHGLMISQEFRN